MNNDIVHYHDGDNGDDNNNIDDAGNNDLL